jgi:cytochrome c-type biogenesis protein CcmH/NrfG
LPAVVLAVTVVLASLTYVRSRLYADPAAIWRDATENSPQSSRAWYNLGVTVANLPVPRPGEADADYREAVQLDSTDADALLRLVISDLGRSDDAEGATLLHRYPLANGNDTILAGMGNALLAANDSIGALLVLQRLAEAPTSAAPLVSLARLYMAAHRPDLAGPVFARAIEIDPRNAAAIAGLAEAKRAVEAGEPKVHSR